MQITFCSTFKLATTNDIMPSQNVNQGNQGYPGFCFRDGHWTRFSFRSVPLLQTPSEGGRRIQDRVIKTDRVYIVIPTRHMSVTTAHLQVCHLHKHTHTRVRVMT